MSSSPLSVRRPSPPLTSLRISNGEACSTCSSGIGYRYIAGAFLPQTAHAQEYPWCLSREGYLYCFYTTQRQCQWTASGIGGCGLNPRLLFPIKPRDS